MQYLRRSSVVVVLCVLSTVAPAQAECAWVLWNEVNRDDGEVVWIAVQAEAMKGECDLAVKGKVKDAASEGAMVKGNIIRPLSLPLTYRFVCLPDTVDPGVPKGKCA